MTATGLLRFIVRTSLWLVARTPILRRGDLTGVICDAVPVSVNLPGKLGFFATPPTDPAKVNALLARLHPVTCTKKLVRLGPDGDGGYLVPDDLEGIVACFSPGVSTVAGFELDCARLGMDVFLADASVDFPPENHPRFHFLKKFIGAATRENFIAFSDWVQACATSERGEFLLQIDIEGYEYETFLSAPSSLLDRFRIVVVEFHFLDHLFCAPLFNLYAQVFEKLLLTHTCVHIHPNNIAGTIKVGNIELPQMAEFTFYRNDRVHQPAFATTFPHPLDRDNADGAPLILSKSLYRSAAGS